MKWKIDYRISADAVRDAEELGFSGTVEGKLEYMLHEAVPFTHALGNLRYEQFVFHVVDGLVVSVARLHDGFAEEAPAQRRRLGRRERKAAVLH